MRATLAKPFWQGIQRIIFNVCRPRVSLGACQGVYHAGGFLRPLARMPARLNGPVTSLLRRDSVQNCLVCQKFIRIIVILTESDSYNDCFVRLAPVNVTLDHPFKKSVKYKASVSELHGTVTLRKRQHWYTWARHPHSRLPSCLIATWPLKFPFPAAAASGPQESSLT